MNDTKTIRVAELFAGIGGFRLGLERANLSSAQLQAQGRRWNENEREVSNRGSSITSGKCRSDSGQFRIVWANELDKYACQIYRKTLEKKNSLRVTSARLKRKTFQTLICSLEDSPVRLLAWLENVRGSRTVVERSFSRLPESQKLKDLRYFCLRTSKDSSATTMETRLKPSCERWGTWGIGGSTRCLTANISGFRRIGKECSLSDILEEQVDEKYFLSEKLLKGLLNHAQKAKEKGNGFGLQIHSVAVGASKKETLSQTPSANDTTKTGAKT